MTEAVHPEDRLGGGASAAAPCMGRKRLRMRLGERFGGICALWRNACAYVCALLWVEELVQAVLYCAGFPFLPRTHNRRRGATSACLLNDIRFTRSLRVTWGQPALPAPCAACQGCCVHKRRARLCVEARSVRSVLPADASPHMHFPPQLQATSPLFI